MDEYLLIQIFKRLPPKTLCRFQSLNKYFKSLITSSFFINLHRNFTSSATPYRLKPYLLQEYHNLFICKKPSIDLCRPIASPHPLSIPFHSPQKDPTFCLIDCIHGVLCFSRGTEIVLCNPTIQKYLTLPLPQFDLGGIGFGYDSNSDDFKVVWIINRQSNYLVYSCRRGCWSPPIAASVNLINGRRRCWSSPIAASVDLLNWRRITTPCFVNGAIHWIIEYIDIRRGRREHLVWFDCAGEEWRSAEVSKEMKSVNKLVEFNGKLGALVRNEFGQMTEMWIRDGIGNVWNLCFNLSVKIGWPLVDDLSLPPCWNDDNLSLYEKHTYHVYEETVFNESARNPVLPYTR